MTTRHMVETQIKPRGVSDPRVLKAMETVPRDRFVLDGYKNLAFSDCPLPIHGGQTISQPYMVATMTEMLKVDEHSKVLEIGTGSGYQTAVLSRVVAQVFTVEILTSLGRTARELLDELGYDNISYHLGDGHLGWPEYAPYDAIIVTAAPEQIPHELIEQLKPGSRMVIPVGPTSECQELCLIERQEDGGFEKRSVMPVRFVPLVHGN